MTPGAWVLVTFACFLIVATYCAWEERRDERRYQADFREHLAHPEHPDVEPFEGEWRDEREAS